MRLARDMSCETGWSAAHQAEGLEGTSACERLLQIGGHTPGILRAGGLLPGLERDNRRCMSGI